MLAKSSKTPQGRLLSLFDILQDWVNAPHIHIEIDQIANHENLLDFCIKQATACKAANPEILAEHIILIAKNALAQALDQNAIRPNESFSARPNEKIKHDNFAHAKKAANALILAQTQNEFTLSKPARLAIAAAIILTVGVSAIWLPQVIQDSQFAGSEMQISAEDRMLVAAIEDNDSVNKGLTAHDAVEMYAKYEQMRKGTCQFPEALQIPDKHKAIYLENVVGGKLPTDLNNLAIANLYLEKVRCNFTPMLMANSK